MPAAAGVFGPSLPMHILLSSTLNRLSSLSSDKLVESELLMPVQTSNDSFFFFTPPHVQLLDGSVVSADFPADLVIASLTFLKI